MEAVDGALFVMPLFITVFNGYCHFDQFAVVLGKIGVIANVSVLFGAAFLSVFRMRSIIYFGIGLIFSSFISSPHN